MNTPHPKPPAAGGLTLDGTYTAAQLSTRDPNLTSTSAGETLTVSAVPEPSAWMTFDGVADLAGWTA